MSNKFPFYNEDLVIPSYLTDCNFNLKLDSLFMLLQELSNRHASALGQGWHDLKKSGFFWIISKMTLKINNLPQWTDKVKLTTWVRSADTATSPRDYLIEDADGNTLISGVSSWAILDDKQGKPQRMNEFYDCFEPQQKEALQGKPRRIQSIQLKENQNIATKHVEISDIDMNQHVNNAHYIQWAVNSIPEAFYRTKAVQELSVNFITQAKMGDVYSICSEHISDSEVITSIYSDVSNKEFCRIYSKWK